MRTIQKSIFENSFIAEFIVNISISDSDNNKTMSHAEQFSPLYEAKIKFLFTC